MKHRNKLFLLFTLAAAARAQAEDPGLFILSRGLGGAASIGCGLYLIIDGACEALSKPSITTEQGSININADIHEYDIRISAKKGSITIGENTRLPEGSYFKNFWRGCFKMILGYGCLVYGRSLLFSGSQTASFPS